MSKFEQDLKDGKCGERVAREILERQLVTRQVIDCRDDERSRTADVDFLWIRTDGQIRFVEVKTDFIMHQTNNIAYELTTSGNVGCFEKTKADYIMYYDAVSKIMYALTVSKLREYIHKNKAQEKPRKMGDYATGYLLSLDEIKRAKIVAFEWKNED